jgi:hypothetical protein
MTGGCETGERIEDECKERQGMTTRDRHLILGIDPGKYGAIAGLWTQEAPCRSEMRPQAWVTAMPHVINLIGKSTSVLDVRAITFMFSKCIKELGTPDRILVMIERVWVHPGMNGASMITLIRNAGLIAGAAMALGFKVVEIPPSVWKAFYPELKPEEGTTKRQKKVLSLNLARKMYPEIDLSMVKHEGHAEALLIANYGLQTQSDFKEMLI